MAALEKYHKELIVPPSTLADTRFGEAVAIVTEREAITFTEFARRVRLSAAALCEAGISKGDVVAVRSFNSIELIVVLTALIEIGAVAAPLPDRYPTRSLARMCVRIGVRHVIDHSAGRHSVAGEDSDSDLVGHSITTVTPTKGEASGELQIARDPNRIALAIFTSGSSGDPKAAALSWSNLHFSALGSNRNVPLGQGDRWLLSLPLYHVGGIGILIRCFLAGAAVALPDDPRDVATAISSLEVTHVSLVAAQLQRLLLRLPLGTQLKSVLVGGGRVPPDMIDRARRGGLPVRVTYGLTEMASQVATAATSSPPGDASGQILPFRSVRIRGDEQEILVRGETLFGGYLEGGDVVSAADEDGWFHTGDSGRFDAQYSLIVAGRLDDMIVSGGENIFPEEIERLVDDIAGIERSIVVGIRDPEFGARPVAFVSYSGQPVSTEQILKRLSGVLPRYKLPVAVFELPSSAERSLSKVSRQHLRGIAYTMLQEMGLIDT